MFTKIDLWWSYNNIRIKKRDEWKAAFSMLKRAFELMVMFFRLTESPATFQVMMNNLLRNMIEIGDITAFIDDVMVGTKTKEGHDVEKVLRKMVENGLFVKLEKCV